MRKSKLLSKLLSGVCCLAMLMTMLPIVPVAAADNAVLFQDDFNSYSANADLPMGDKFKLGSTQVRKDAATPGSYSFTTANGALKLSATDVVDSGDIGEVYAGVATTATFGGSYTLTFDWMQETEDVYCTILYLAGTEVRVRMQNPTSTSALYNTVFFVKDGNKYLTNPDSGAQFKFGAAFGTWYTFEYFVDADAASVTLNVYDKASGEQLGTYTLKGAPVDDKGLEIRHFGVQGNDEAGKTSTCWVDNLKVVSGIVETDREGGAATGTTISGGSLNSFSDSAEITYTKAAEITAGLGLFAGADGKFMPKGTVTRAQMATIIVKMLNGADANADTFKGTGKFNDVAGFEGGWAEGYVNWCSTLGIVSGYGDGTFRPGNQVTAAEAATMILNALKVDAGAGTWPHTVMAKAEELNMFDDLLTKPANDKPLSREELAVMALVGLEYSPEGKQGYEYNGVTYDSFMDAYMVAGPTNAGKINPTAGDSLAGKVFEMQTFEGFIVANQATDPELAGLTVVSKKVDGVNVDKTFFITTGLEHVGHYVTVYYSETYTSERDPGLTYTIYDETQVFAVDEAVTTAKEYKAVFDRSYKAADKVALFGGNYVVSDLAAGALTDYTPGSAAKEGTYFVYDGAIVAYMATVPVKATKVLAVETVKGYETIELNLSEMPPIANSEDDDRIVEYKGIAEDDYVTYVEIGDPSNPIYVLSKTKPVTGSVTKIGTNKDGDQVIVVKGKEYTEFTGENTTGLTNSGSFDFKATYTFYVTDDGKYVGYEKNDTAADLTNTVFVLGQTKVVQTDSYGKKVQTTYARGLDLDGNEVMLPFKVENGTYDASTKTFTPTDAITEQVDTIKTGFFMVEDAQTKEAKKEALKVLTAFSATYDEDKHPIYSATSNIGVGKPVSPYNFGVSGMIVYRNTAAPYLMLEGTLDQTTALTATVKKGSWSTFINETGATINRYLLLSRADNGTAVLEAMVMHVTGDGALDTKTVYISDAAVAAAERSSEGWVYNVYNYKTGAAEQITLENGVDGTLFDGGSFYKVAAVEDSSCHEIVAKIPDVYESGASGLKYDNVDERVEEDGLYNENLFLDQVLHDITNNELNTNSLANRENEDHTKFKGYRQAKADGAIVIDTRSQDDIDAFGLGKISDLARIESLTARNENLVIVFDVCYDTSGKKVLTVFVKDVYYLDTDGVTITDRNGVTYINGRPLAEDYDVEYLGSNENVDPAKLGDAAYLMSLQENNTINMDYTIVNGQINELTITAVAPKLPGKLVYVESADGKIDFGGAEKEHKGVLTESVKAWVLDPAEEVIYEAGEEFTLPVGTKLAWGTNKDQYSYKRGNTYTCVIDGEVLSLTGLKLSSGYPNRKGYHNELVSFVESTGTLSMVDAHAYYGDSETGNTYNEANYEGNHANESVCFSYGTTYNEAPLTLTGLTGEEVVYTAGDPTTLKTLAQRTDKKIVLDYFLNEDGTVAFMYLWDDSEAAVNRYIPAEGDVLYFGTNRYIGGLSSNKADDADAVIIASDTRSIGEQVRVRYLDIASYEGGPVLKDKVYLPAGYYVCSYNEYGGLVVTLLKVTDLEDADIAAMPSADVVDIRSEFVLGCPKIEDLDTLKTVSANADYIVTAALVSVGGSDIVIVSNVTTKLLASDTFDYSSSTLPYGGANDVWKSFKFNNRSDGTGVTVPGSYELAVMKETGTSNNVLKMSATAVKGTSNTKKTVDMTMATTKSFSGDYTISLDWMQETKAAYVTQLKFAGGVDLRLRPQESSGTLYNTLFVYAAASATTSEESGFDTASGSNYYLFLKDTSDSSRFTFGDNNEGKWYTIKANVKTQAGTITISIYERGSDTPIASRTLEGFSLKAGTISIAHNSAQNGYNQEVSTCYIDNLRVVADD